MRKLVFWMAPGLVWFGACTFSTPSATDPYHACFPDGTCVDGCECVGKACVPDGVEKMRPEECNPCPLHHEDCDGQDGNGCEINLRLDPANCGGCGEACAPGEVCELGVCVQQCRPELWACGRSCVDLRSDPLHCGSCGNVCAASEVCDAGACAPECTGGRTGCEGACVDTLTDAAHCGGCGELCLVDHGKAICQEGACEILHCFHPHKDCNQDPADGCEVDTSSDPDHCRNCFAPCGDHADCIEGNCTCDAYWGDCDGGWDNGCETSLLDDPENCDQCGIACDTPPMDDFCLDSQTAVQYSIPGNCEAGVCTYNQGSRFCELGCSEGDCIQLPCGGSGCGPNAQCVDDACQCDDGWEDCDGETGNGCEANTGTDPEHCGGCTACPVGESCCDGECFNLKSDPAHCGSCGNQCLGAATCLDSKCGTPNVTCGGAECDLTAGEACCFDEIESMFFCDAQGACPDIFYECDDNQDCVEGYTVCCHSLPDGLIAGCLPQWQCMGEILCSSDLECQELTGGQSPFCCPADMLGTEFHLCRGGC